jgi:hypothetical protein
MARGVRQNVSVDDSRRQMLERFRRRSGNRRRNVGERFGGGVWDGDSDCAVEVVGRVDPFEVQASRVLGAAVFDVDGSDAAISMIRAGMRVAMSTGLWLLTTMTWPVNWPWVRRAAAVLGRSTCNLAVIAHCLEVFAEAGDEALAGLLLVVSADDSRR